MFVLFILMMQLSYAAEQICPEGYRVKKQSLVHATQNIYDPDLWEFTTDSFWFAGRKWWISFGMFLPDIKNADAALLRGQKYFTEAKLIIENPRPVAIPKHIVCHYIPNGYSYWLSALAIKN